jgi:hypothetical protein
MKQVAVGVEEVLKQTMRQSTPFMHKVLPFGGGISGTNVRHVLCVFTALTCSHARTRSCG